MDDTQRRLVEHLRKRYACYVLLTCSEATEDGDMSVEFRYDGDPALASLMLEGALDSVAKEHFSEASEEG